jgi:hypothetical protein
VSALDRDAAIARWMVEAVCLVEALRELLDERDRLREENRDLATRLAEAADGLAAVLREMERLGPLAERMREDRPAGPTPTFFRRPSRLA